MPPENKTDPITVAVVNSSEEVVDLIREVLEDNGFATVAGHVPDFKRGRADFDQFMQQHKPRVVVWDISPPYDDNWAYFQQEIHDRPSCAGCRFVITTTNHRVLTRLVGETGAIEIVGKPFDLELLLKAVMQDAAER